MGPGKNIAFFGSSLVSAYWNGAATYYRGLIRALNALGYDITFFEPDAFQRQEHRDLPDPPWAMVDVYEASRSGVAGAIERASLADIIIKASGVGVFDERLERDVAALRSPDRRAIFWDVDAPATLDRCLNNPSDAFCRLIPEYDAILTYGGGPPVVEAYARLGARDCIPIYNALDATTHFPVEPAGAFECDLAFLGNRLPDREARVEEFFFKAARLLPDRSFIIGGSGWEQADLPGNVRRVGHVYTHQHNAFNCSARAVLNISRASMARYGFSPATRVFEVAGAGGCLITDAWEGVEQFLEPGSEVLVARDGEEVAEHLSRLDGASAASIGAAALRRVLNDHTYTHRAGQVHEVLQSLRQDATVVS